MAGNSADGIRRAAAKSGTYNEITQSLTATARERSAYRSLTVAAKWSISQLLPRFRVPCFRGSSQGIATLQFPPRKHAEPAKTACFRGGLAPIHPLHTIRESMAPESETWSLFVKLTAK